MNVDQAAFHLLAPFTDMPMRCLPEFSFKQFSSAIIFQHTHLLDGYPVQSHEPFALRYALVYEYGVQVFHIGEADQFIDGGIVTDIALSQDLEQNRPVEAREHVRRFHELFFTLSPDKNAIEGNIRRAMFLSDRSAYAHYVDLAEQGYYNRIISGNVNQRVGIDSVKCDFHTYPYEVVTYAKLSIIREKSVTERSLVTRGRLLNSTRSDNNPHGFILEAFRVVENRDIRVYDR